MKIIWNHQVSFLLKEIDLLWMEMMLRDVLISLFLKCRLIPQQYLNMGKIKLKRKLVNWLINVQVFKYVAEVVIWKNSNPEHRSLEFREKHGIELDDVVICFDGRLVDEKRSDIFADVICRMEQQQLPNTVYIGWLNF